MTRHRRPVKTANAAGFPRGLVFLALIVGIGLTFYIGMHYGKARGLQSAQGLVQENKLSRLDRQAQELRQRRAQERARLSFHSTLAGPAREIKRPAAKSAAKDSKSKTAAAEKNKEAVDAPATQDKVEATAKKSTVALADTTATKIQEAESASEQDQQELDSQDELVEEPEPSHFSLQVGAFPDAGSAQNLVERLSEKGYSVRIVSAKVAGKGTWYRVRVGDFSARAKAEQKRSQLSDHEGLFALVVPERG